ncbi:MAG: hypothetical protein HN886_01935 [Woeseiaceae bacterium]|jgi:hypothetical protein|nr:hypothetical protein [Woeseiaceae bacterium]
MDITNRYYKHMWLIIALLCSGCASNLLNSERIEKKFGSYGIEIIENTGSSRVSFLYSLDKNCQQNLSLKETQIGIHCKQYKTLAIVKFLNTNDVIDEHTKILKGASIGATFKNQNWIIKKENILISEIHNKENQIINEWSNNPDLEKFAFQIYDISLKKNQLQLKYAQIIEIHNPNYLIIDDLIEIYDESYQINAAQITLASYKTEIYKLLNESKTLTTTIASLRNRRN